MLFVEDEIVAEGVLQAFDDVFVNVREMFASVERHGPKDGIDPVEPFDYLRLRAVHENVLHRGADQLVHGHVAVVGVSVSVVTLIGTLTTDGHLRVRNGLRLFLRWHCVSNSFRFQNAFVQRQQQRTSDDLLSAIASFDLVR